MQTIQLTLDGPMLEELDRVTHSLAMTHTAFVFAAVELALRRQGTLALERQHAQGYALHPVTSGEISEWETEQVWGDL